MFKIVLATFTFSMVLTSGSFAASVSCKQFVDSCTSFIDNQCTQVISGALQTEVARGHVCLTQYSMNGLVGILNHWADLHPNELHSSGWDCTVKALIDAFPCQGTGR